MKDCGDVKSPGAYIQACQLGRLERLGKEFSKYYVATYILPSHPTSLMVSLLLLISYRIEETRQVVEQWRTHNPPPTGSISAGRASFQWDSSDLVHFQKHIGKEGVRKIFELCP